MSAAFVPRIILSIVLVATIATTQYLGDENSLSLLHVIFRHGERTTDNGRYPNDPYLNESYYPYGSGQLTNEGKRTEYKIGQALRNKYNNFLSDFYTPDCVNARSTNTERTKMSLQLALAGLYPPVGPLIWKNGISWQPIPASYVPMSEDKEMFPILCKYYNGNLTEYLQSEEYAKTNLKYRRVMNYISRYAGIQYNSTSQLAALYFTLATEFEWGFALPTWTKKVFPEPLRQIAAENYITSTATAQLKRMASGALLKKIVFDSLEKLNGGLQNTKIFLYSGHEINVGHMLRTLDVFEPQIPSYGSYVTFEVHSANEQYAVRIFYQNYTTTEAYVLTVPGCEVYCPLNKFISLYENYFPEENADYCGGSLYELDL